MFSDVALLHTGKWHLWPRSVTFADELNSALRESILSSAVKLHDGDIAIIRRDETTLGPLEEGLLRRIRANSTLCTLPEQIGQGRCLQGFTARQLLSGQSPRNVVRERYALDDE